MEMIDGVSCIKGEIHSIMTSMRLTTRWSNAKNIRTPNPYQDNENPFVSTFRKLNEYLEGIFDLIELDTVKYISPFYDVIVSDQASGPLTSAALSSVCKFAMFGFLSTQYPRCQEGILLVAKCISRCIFEETDWESDEVILMKLLELSTLTLRCDASKLLSVGATWDIYSTCLSIHNQFRASKILRSEAETALRHLTQSAFSKVHQIVNFKDLETASSLEALNLTSQSWDSISESYLFDGPIGITLLLCNVMSVLSNLMNLQTEAPGRVKFALSLVNIALEAGGPMLSSMLPLVEVLKGEVSRHLLRATQSEDLEIFSLALRVIFNLFMSIKDHMKVQLEVFLSSIHLRLLQHTQNTFLGQAKQELVLESLLEFCREPSLMQDLYTNYDCDVQCTNLFDSIVTVLCERCHPIKSRKTAKGIDTVDGLATDLVGKSTILNRLAVSGVASILHAVAIKCRKSKSPNFVDSMRQYETSVSTIAQNKSNRLSDRSCLKPTDNSSNLKFVPLRNGVDWSEVPTVGHVELDLSSKDVKFSSLISLRKPIPSVNPDSSAETYYSEPPAPAELIRNPSNLSLCCGDDWENTAGTESTANMVEILRHRKLRKQRLLHASEMFNEKPLKLDWVRFALDQQLILPNSESGAASSTFNESFPADPRSVAKFLKNTPGLGRTQIGEYISKGPADKHPFHAAVLREYVNTFDFASGNDVSFVKALRTFLGHFRLPGEAQCIDRLMEAFARKLFEDLGVGKPFASADAAFVLAFSTIMLQTDLHNPNVTTKRMTKEDFIRNNRGINDGESLPREYLEALYEEIKSKKIEVDIDINDSDLTQAFNLTDTASWNKLIRRSAAYQAPAAFTPTFAARRGARELPVVPLDPHVSLHEKDMFLVMEERILITVLALWQSNQEDLVIAKTYQMLWDYATVCVDLQLSTMFNEFLQSCFSKARVMLDRTRRSPTREPALNKALTKQFYQRLWALEIQHGNHDLSNLVKIPIEELIVPEGVAVSPIQQINWVGLCLVKGEIMAKFAFSVVEKFFQILDKGTISAVITFTLWLRNRGALPSYLSVISNIWTIQGHNVIADFSRFQPSAFAVASHRRARGLHGHEPVSTRKNTTSSLLESVTNLLFSPLSSEEEHERSLAGPLESLPRTRSPPDIDNAVSFETSIDLNSCVFSSPIEFQQSLTDSSTLNVDNLLPLAVAESPLQNVFNVQRKLKSITHDKFLDDMISVMSEMLLAVTAALLKESKPCCKASAEANNTDFKPWSARSTDLRQNSVKGSDTRVEWKGLHHVLSELGEMDSLFLLEQLVNTVFIDLERLIKVWPTVYCVLKLVLDEKAELACTLYPYFVERCILFTLRCACEIVPQLSDTIQIGSVNGSSDPSLYVTQQVNTRTTEDVWICLRFLRRLPNHYVEVVSGQLSYGLLHFVKPFSGYTRAIYSVEEWYLIFSLLTTATVGTVGRPYVWSALRHIIDSNLISAVNFSPARHLLLRFMFGVFADEKGSESRSKYRDETINEWQLQSMVCLVRLTNMALGGYIYDYASPSIQESILNHKKTVTQICGGSVLLTQSKQFPQLITFPLPSWTRLKVDHAPANMKYSDVDSTKIPAVASQNVSKAQQPNSSSSSIPALIHQSLHSTASKTLDSNADMTMTVVSVHFSKVVEIELLWVESCKTFSDLSNSVVPSVSQHSLYCLEAVLLSGTLSGLDKYVYLKAVCEILSRLPLSLITANDRLQHSQHSSSIQIVYEYSLSSCNLVFRTLIRNFKILRTCVDFNASWLRFVSILATNANLLVRGSNIHNEVLDVIAALFRALNLPIKSNSDMFNNSGSPVNKKSIDESPANTDHQQHTNGGWLAWWSGPQPAIPQASTQTSIRGPSQRQSLKIEPKNSEAIDRSSGVIENENNQEQFENEDEYDGHLLVISWKTVCSLYPSFPSHLRIKFPKLVSDVSDYTDNFEAKMVSRNERVVRMEENIELIQGVLIIEATDSISNEHSFEKQTVETVDGDDLRNRIQIV